MQNEEGNSQSKEQFRVVINRAANIALENFVATINQGADASRVSKSDIANFVFERLCDLLSDSEVGELRALFFDPKKALESILKGEQAMPDDIQEALLKHYGIKSANKEKRSKKLSTPKLVDNVS